MAVILDANALINLYHADILTLIYNSTEYIVPWEVYEEVVTRGRRAGHQDATAIAEIIGENDEFPTTIPPELNLLGLGEAAALSRYLERQRQALGDLDVIVSDDRQFMRYLRREEQRIGIRVPLFTTADLIADLGTSGILTGRQARDGLLRIRDRMPEIDYLAARQRLEA